MMNKRFRKIVIAGGSGYIGKVLTNYFQDQTEEIIVLSRRKSVTMENVRTVQWDVKHQGEWVKELENADALLNLTGKSVNCRYHDKNKREILESRVDATNILGGAISHLKNPPKVWIQYASATIYKHAEDSPMDEYSGEIGEGFSVNVCKKWEGAFWNQHVPGTRKVLLRVAIVFGKVDGVFVRLENLVRFGFGGKHGNGNQMVSWVHDEDLSRITDWILKHEQIEGTFNAASPDPVQNWELMKAIRSSQKVVFGLNAPTWLLRIGAWIIGTETELILKSRWVIPKKLEELGFTFKFKTIKEAIHEITKK
ncbi:MAG TPA: TIGR01777 family oxidoreductase [Cyclobacteriaceae bacterium]|nr:TIGR01777 family oxidoreductase [Cyclobacteriaceae bacterium]